MQYQTPPAIAVPIVPPPSPPTSRPVPTLVVPVSSATIEVVPGAKRLRDDTDNLVDLASSQPPSKRRLPIIGGDRWPSFILPKDISSATGNTTHDPEIVLLPPTLEQREHIQKQLGGNWRYAKTLHQYSLGQGGSKWGFPARSTFLFVGLTTQASL
jgi:hypothetical protein